MHFITSLKTKIDTVIFNLHNKKYQTEIGKNVYLKNCECHNVSGQSNYIKIESNCILRNCIFRFDGSSNKVMIHSGSHLTNVTFWIEGDYNTIDLEKT